MKRLAEISLIIWFALQAADGALRFVFVSAGVPTLVYAKDAILLAIFAYFVLLTVSRFAANRTLTVLFALLLFGFTVGLVNGLSFGQVMFGAKIYLPFLVGFMALSCFDIRDSVFTRLYHIVLPFVLVGLFLDLVITLPWGGFEYELAGTSIEGSRQWGMYGLSRLAGFGRSSFATATELYVLAVLYMAVTFRSKVERSRLKKMFDAMLMVCAIAGIVLTTSKSSIFAMLLILFVYGLIWLMRNKSGRFVRIALKLLLVILLVYGVVPPLISLISPSFITDHLHSDNLVVTALSASYVDRMENMWPAAYDLLRGDMMFLTGRGLGSIGTSQLYFEPDKYNPADNVYLYLLVQFGSVILLLFLIWVVGKIGRITVSRASLSTRVFFLLTLLAFGATMNVVESAPLMILLGMMLAMEERLGLGDDS